MHASTKLVQHWPRVPREQQTFMFKLREKMNTPVFYTCSSKSENTILIANRPQGPFLNLSKTTFFL
jgi:hypothetical protein